jgi:hypothetical protein
MLSGGHMYIYDPWPWDADYKLGGCVCWEAWGAITRTNCVFTRLQYRADERSCPVNTETRKTMRAAVASALTQAPVCDDPLFAAVRRAKVGSPVLDQRPTGEPAFGLVPIILYDKMCGLAEVDLSGQVSRLHMDRR